MSRALMPAKVYYESGISAAAATIERKAIISAESYGVASRQDGYNFRTNMVTLANYNDGNCAGNVLALSTVWACVNLLAGTIASLPLMVYREKDGERAVAYDHPLYRILHDSPNADQTALDFWEFISGSLELQGDGICEIIRRDGQVVALDVPLTPEAVQRRRLSSGLIQYRWTEGGRTREATSPDVLHIRGFGGNPLGGLSTIEYGRRTFRVAANLENAAKDTFENGITANGVFMSKRQLDKEQMGMAAQIVEEKYLGAGNSRRPLILNSDMDYRQLTINPDDAQMLQSRAFSVEEICRFFGVPPHMVGHTEKSSSWGTGVEQMTLGFVKYSLRRRLKRIEQSLEKQLLTPVERLNGMRIEFNLEGLLRGDSANRASFYASGLQNGWFTINEVRAYENMAPVEGGEVPRMQMQNQPITQADAPPETQQ